MRAAPAQLARWRQDGLQIHRAVNVSMENLRAPDFARRGALVHHSRLSPQDGVLEVTQEPCDGHVAERTEMTKYPRSSLRAQCAGTTAHGSDQRMH